MKIWKDIPSLPLYQASNDGDIRNKKTGRVMKQSSTGSSGYLRVFIRKTYLVHRLVAEAFLNKYEYSIVHHKDNNKLNNNIDNLEWTTQSYNVKKAYDDGLASDRKGINNPNHSSKKSKNNLPD